MKAVEHYTTTVGTGATDLEVPAHDYAAEAALLAVRDTGGTAVTLAFDGDTLAEVTVDASAGEDAVYVLAPKRLAAMRTLLTATVGTGTQDVDYYWEKV